MAIRVQTQDNINFGTFAAAATVTHVRVQKGGAAPVVKALAASVAVGAGDQAQINSGDLDIVYPAGQTTNTHMLAVVNPYWDSETFQVDLMTSSTAVVSDSGYSQQTYSNWAISQEAD